MATVGYQCLTNIRRCENNSLVTLVDQLSWLLLPLSTKTRSFSLPNAKHAHLNFDIDVGRLGELATQAGKAIDVFLSVKRQCLERSPLFSACAGCQISYIKLLD